MFPHGDPPHWEVCPVCLRGRRLGDPSGLEDWGALHLMWGLPWSIRVGVSLWLRAVAPLGVDGPPWVVLPHLDPQCPAMLLVYLLCAVNVCVSVRFVCVCAFV